MQGLRICLFGSFEATLDGQPLALPTRKTEAVLAVLALAGGTPVPRDELAQLLWSDRGGPQAQSSLRQALVALRKALADEAGRLASDRATVALDAGSGSVDVIAFLAAAQGGEEAALRRAVDLYRGPFLAGFPDADPAFAGWRDHQARRLQAMAAQALLRLLGEFVDPASGDAEALALRLIAIDPLREAGYRTLMIRAAARGDRAAVLGHHDALVRVLADGIGVPPSYASEALFARLTGSASDHPPALPSLRRPERPSIAVLPFGAGPDDDDAYFADGLTDELISALSRFPHLFVIASGSTFALRGRGDGAAEVSTELGVRYLLRGTVRRDGRRLRIAVQLLDTDRTGVLWADRIDGPVDQVFTLKEQIATRIVGALAPKVEAAEINRALRKRTDNLDAWDLVLRALMHVRTMTVAGHDQALALIARALAVDPDYALAAGLGAWLRTLEVPQAWRDTATAAGEGLRLAAIALANAGDDAEARAMGGYAEAFLGRRYETGLAAVDEALAINPGSARTHGFAGWLRAYVGDHGRATAHFEEALRLSPRDPLAFRIRAGLAFACLFSDDLERALLEGRAALRDNPDFSPTHRVLAAAAAHAGNADEARRTGRQLAAVVPGITVGYVLRETRFLRDADRERLGDGLLRAGLPP